MLDSFLSLQLLNGKTVCKVSSVESLHSMTMDSEPDVNLSDVRWQEVRESILSSYYGVWVFFFLQLYQIILNEITIYDKFDARYKTSYNVYIKMVLNNEYICSIDWYLRIIHFEYLFTLVVFLGASMVALNVKQSPIGDLVADLNWKMLPLNWRTTSHPNYLKKKHQSLLIFVSDIIP